MKNEVEETPVIEPAVEEKSLVLPIVITALVTAVVFSGIFALIFVFGFNDSTPVENGLSVKTYQSVAKSNCQKTGGNFDMDSGCNCGEAKLEEDTGFCVFDDGSFGGEFGELQKAFLESKMDEVSEKDVSEGKDDVVEKKNPVEASSYTLYQSSAGGYSFMIPTDWYVGVSPSGSAIPERKNKSTLYGPDPVSQGGLGAVDYRGEWKGDLDTYLAEGIDAGLIVQSKKSITIDGYPAYYVEHNTFPAPGFAVYIAKGSERYSISIISKLPSNKKVFDKIVETFKFTK